MKRDTIGYTICMYTKNGGCASTWFPTLAEACDEIKNWKGEHDGITIVKLPHKKRMSRFVITKPDGLRDSGIFTTGVN